MLERKCLIDNKEQNQSPGGVLLKKRLQHRCLPVNFAKFQRAPFFIEHLQWLLLKKIEEGQYTNIKTSLAMLFK